MPSTFTFATHDWEIVPPSTTSQSLVQEWRSLWQDPRFNLFNRTFIQNNPHHYQLSILTERYNWRDLDRLADQTEAHVRGVVEAVLQSRASAFRSLHLAVFKALDSDPGYGFQQLHYDFYELTRAKQMVSVLIYCSDTMSTEFPLYDKEAMRPAFIVGDQATPSEELIISCLIRDENFRSYPVKAGSIAVFTGAVCHRGINNPDQHQRPVLYLLFSPSKAKHQDVRQRIPNRQPTHAPLTPERRWAIVNYHKLQMTVQSITLLVGCTPQTVYHWINDFNENGTVDDDPRTGRLRISIPPLKEEAQQHPFASTPRMLKAKLQIRASKRTIRRRLNDDLLFGRVSRHFFKLFPDTVRARLSFANGYKDWTKEMWMKVLFSDEKIFTLGNHGQVWVQRPRGEAWNPKYSREVESHPAGINFWCCFSGHGTGGCETFSYNNTGPVMRAILQYHLINSARKFYRSNPPELWWLLWDNSPIHRSGEVLGWLHRNGVHCLELPPYSPDCNPTENLFADLARRVEQHYPITVEELEEAIHTEWPLTNQTFLSHLAQSMPRRIEAILNNAGHATKY
jgi:transposase